MHGKMTVVQVTYTSNNIYLHVFLIIFNSPEIKKVQSAPIESEKKSSETKKPLLGDIIKDANSQGRYYMGR